MKSLKILGLALLPLWAQMNTKLCSPYSPTPISYKENITLGFYCPNLDSVQVQSSVHLTQVFQDEMGSHYWNIYNLAGHQGGTDTLIFKSFYGTQFDYDTVAVKLLPIEPIDLSNSNSSLTLNYNGYATHNFSWLRGNIQRVRAYSKQQKVYLYADPSGVQVKHVAGPMGGLDTVIMELSNEISTVYDTLYVTLNPATSTNTKLSIYPFSDLNLNYKSKRRVFQSIEGIPLGVSLKSRHQLVKIDEVEDGYVLENLAGPQGGVDTLEFKAYDANTTVLDTFIVKLDSVPVPVLQTTNYPQTISVHGREYISIPYYDYLDKGSLTSKNGFIEISPSTPTGFSLYTNGNVGGVWDTLYYQGQNAKGIIRDTIPIHILAMTAPIILPNQVFYLSQNIPETFRARLAGGEAEEINYLSKSHKLTLRSYISRDESIYLEAMPDSIGWDTLIVTAKNAQGSDTAEIPVLIEPGQKPMKFKNKEYKKVYFSKLLQFCDFDVGYAKDFTAQFKLGNFTTQTESFDLGYETRNICGMRTLSNTNNLDTMIQIASNNLAEVTDTLLIQTFPVKRVPWIDLEPQTLAMGEVNRIINIGDVYGADQIQVRSLKGLVDAQTTSFASLLKVSTLPGKSGLEQLEMTFSNDYGTTVDTLKLTVRPRWISVTTPILNPKQSHEEFFADPSFRLYTLRGELIWTGKGQSLVEIRQQLQVPAGSYLLRNSKSQSLKLVNP